MVRSAIFKAISLIFFTIVYPTSYSSSQVLFMIEKGIFHHFKAKPSYCTKGPVSDFVSYASFGVEGSQFCEIHITSLY